MSPPGETGRPGASRPGIMGEDGASRGFPAYRSSAFDIATVFILYGILLVVALSTIGGYAGDIYRAATAPLGLAAAVALAIGLGMVALTALFLVRSSRNLRGAPSARRLRVRLSLAFGIMALASTLPQALLGWRAVTAAERAWFLSGTADSIAQSERLAVALSGLLSAQLRAAAEQDLPVLSAGQRNFQELFARLRDYRPEIVALQGFSESGADLFAGDGRYRVPASAAAGATDGEFPALNLERNYAIRYLKTVGQRRYLLSLQFPASWLPAAETLQRASRANEAVAAAIPRFGRITALLYLMIALPLLLVSAIAGVALADSIARPLAGLERATGRVAAGDLRARVLVGPSGEFSQLSAAFNRMVGEIDRYRAVLLQEEKENAWQDIARKLAHEVKNPLTPIRLSAERVLRKHRADPAAASAIIEPAMLAILQEVEGLSALLSDFKEFARLPEPRIAWTPLAPVLEDIASVYRQSHPGISLDLSGVGPDAVLKADPGQLRQLFVNLIANAIDAMGGEGPVRIRADLVKYSNTLYCRIEVRDSGPGIPAELQDKLFTPYFTTKGNGTGLGLSIAEHIVMSHQGRIWCESEGGAGAAFYVDLPADPASGRTGSKQDE